MNIVFMGTPQYATTILSAILKEKKINVVGIFTKPDKPVGRKQILTPPDIKKFIIDNNINIPIFQPNTLKSQEIFNTIKELKPDFIVVAAYGQILPKDILNLCPCINLHASILPKYRGASPIQSAIMSGETQTGVTAMLMDEGLDTGDMLNFAYTSCKDKMAIEVFNDLSNLASKLAVDTLLNFKNITPIKQDDSKSTKCSKIKKELGLIDFNQSASEIYNKFRALMPWPGIYTNSGLKLIDIGLEEKNCINEKTGTIVKIDKDSFLVSCKNGVIRIKQVQEVGKKTITAKDYINGKRLECGSKVY